MSNLQIPLNSHINTADDFVIKDITTEDKDVLNKKNTLQYKSLLSPMYTKSEEKVYTTSGHTIEKTSNTILTDEKGRRYSVDNSWVVENKVDISGLWSGELTSGLIKGDYVYSVWKNETEYTVIVSDFDNNILHYNIVEAESDALWYNVKIANYINGLNDAPVYLAATYYTSSNTTKIRVYTIDTEAQLTSWYSNTYGSLYGSDLYVLALSTTKIAIGFDDIDLRRRRTIITEDGTTSSTIAYFGCLGTNGLLTGEPVWRGIQSSSNAYVSNGDLLSDLSTDTATINYLSNGIAYSRQMTATTPQGTTASDTQLITANTADYGLGANEDIDRAAVWGSSSTMGSGTKHYRYGNSGVTADANKNYYGFVAGYDLIDDIPLVLSPSYITSYSGAEANVKGHTVALSEAYYVMPTLDGACNDVYMEQVDFSDGWGNITWDKTTTASIVNGCNPFPYTYTIMNRAESKGRYWDYGPGWAKCYYRQGIIRKYTTTTSYGNTKYLRTFVEDFPTSIISFGLSSDTGANSVRIEYLDPIKINKDSTIDEDEDEEEDETFLDPATLDGWVYDATNANYYKYHILDEETHTWVNFFGAANLGDQTILNKMQFNVDLVPSLNIKEQYYGLVFASISMQGTLLTSASVNKNSTSQIYTEDDSSVVNIFSNGLAIKCVANGDIKLEKIADYIYRTNTLTGNNLFLDTTDGFYGQRGFIPYNSEEIITLSDIDKYSPLDDDLVDGNDNYFSVAAYNENLTDMKKRGVSYLLPASQITLAVNSEEIEDFTFQLSSNKKEITKPYLYNQFTYKDDEISHYYTHTQDTTSINYQTSKKMVRIVRDESEELYGVSTYNIDKEAFTWWITSEAFYYPMGIASIVSGINYLASTINMTDDYTVRLYRTQNTTFPIYNPSTEVYRGSTIFTIYGYNYSFDGQSIYYLGSGDTTSDSSFACYAMGMQFLANSGTEAYFYSPFEKRLYLFTGSVTLQISDSLAREGEIVDSLYSPCEQILYLLTDEGKIIAKTQQDMAIIEEVSTDYHFEGTDDGMILADGFNYIKYRLYSTDETEWLPIEVETEYLGNNDNLYKVSNIAITFFKNSNDTVTGEIYYDYIYDKSSNRISRTFTISAKDWDNSSLKKVIMTVPNNIVKAFRFGITSDDYISIANIAVNAEMVSQNTNSEIHI